MGDRSGIPGSSGGGHSIAVVSLGKTLHPPCLVWMCMNVNVGGGRRGRRCSMAATLPSVCPRAAVATDVAYHHLYVWVWTQLRRWLILTEISVWLNLPQHIKANWATYKICLFIIIYLAKYQHYICWRASGHVLYIIIYLFKHSCGCDEEFESEVHLSIGATVVEYREQAGFWSLA